MPGLPRAQDRPEWADDLDRWHLLTPTRIVLILVIALILTWMARRFVGRVVRGITSVSERTSLVQDRARSASRAHTVSVVLRSALVGLIWSITVLLVLGQLGVDLGAFVAATAIIGGAIGFGAQQAVRDYLAGFFMISEDQLGVGDAVDIGIGGVTVTGVVESVTLRVVCVRDTSGVLWWVPNGQITRVGNKSQDWSAAVLDVRLPAEADVAEASATLERLAAEVVAAEPAATVVTAPPVVEGPVALDATAVVLRVTVRTTPGHDGEVMLGLRAALQAAHRTGALPLAGSDRLVVVEREPAAGPPADAAE